MPVFSDDARATFAHTGRQLATALAPIVHDALREAVLAAAVVTAPPAPPEPVCQCGYVASVHNPPDHEGSCTMICRCCQFRELMPDVMPLTRGQMLELRAIPEGFVLMWTDAAGGVWKQTDEYPAANELAKSVELFGFTAAALIRRGGAK